MTIYEDIIKEREEKIIRLEQELKDKDIELLDMYKDLEYFKGKINEKKAVNKLTCEQKTGSKTLPKGWK